MSTFRVGQRVRFARATVHDCSAIPIGTEGTILAHWTPDHPLYRRVWDWEVKFDGFRAPANAMSNELEPLVDPKAEEFVRRVTKPQPQVVPVRERFISKIESVVGPLGDDVHSQVFNSGK